MKKQLILTLSIFLLATFSALAQLQDPVKWSTKIKSLGNNEAELIFEAKIDAGWHLYGQYFPDGGPVQLVIEFEENSNYQLIGKTREVPEPHKEVDEIFGIEVHTFDDKASFIQKIKILSETDFKVNAVVDGQACLDDGMCVLVGGDFSFNVPGATPADAEEIPEEATEETVENTDVDSLAAIADTIPQQDLLEPENDSTSAALLNGDETATETVKKGDYDLKDESLWVLFWFSFLAGLLAILTPCVFPMIPMTVTFFMHGSESKAKGRFQALVYGISIILIYTVIGTLVAVLFGANFANFLSTHWLPNILFFLIFMVFAASFLGMFEITLPSSWVNKMDKQADRGGMLGAFFMAFTLVLVSFSCTGPLVGAILVESAGGAVIEPIIGMFGFSLAFALPFTLFAFFPAWLGNLPKSGGWLNAVKVVLGFIELALGLKFLSIADQTYHWGILDREVYLAFWIVIFTLMGFYLLGKLKFSHDSDLKHISVPRLTLAIITFTFVIYMIPGMFGAPLKMLSGYIPPQSTHDFDLHKIIRENSSGGGTITEHSSICDLPKHSDIFHLPHGLEGYFDYEQGMACAREQNKPVFIDFTGHGCVNCREMEANVWSHPDVLKRLREDYIVIALYVDDKTKLPEEEWYVSDYDNKTKKTIGKQYADFQISRFGVNAQPYYVLLDNEGDKLVDPRAYDLDIQEFIEFLDKGVEEFEKRESN